MVQFTMKAANALQRNRNWNKNRSQEFLGSLGGVTRGTYNGAVGLFSEPVNGRMDDDQRRGLSQRNKDRARAAGKQVHDDRPMRNRDCKRIGVLLHKAPMYGCSLQYSDAIPDHMKPDRSKRLVCLVCEEIRDRLEQGDSPEELAARFDMSVKEIEHRAQKCEHFRCRDAQMYARHYGVDMFDATAHVNGDQAVLGCGFHPRLPDANDCLCALGQLKLAFQEVCPHCKGRGYMIGLKWNKDESKWEESFLPWGPRFLLAWLQLKAIRKKPLQRIQAEMAEEMGIDPNTFYAWRRKLEWLGFIRVVPGEIYRSCTSCGQQYIQSRDHGRRQDGARCRCGGSGPVDWTKPDKLIWHPDEVFDPEMAARERERFNALGLAVSRRDEQSAIKALEVHRRVLASWTGNQHSLQAFWNECAKQSRAAGLPRELIGFLYPQRE